jgi:hypothetical protein
VFASEDVYFVREGSLPTEPQKLSSSSTIATEKLSADKDSNDAIALMAVTLLFA